MRNSILNVFAMLLLSISVSAAEMNGNDLAKAFNSALNEASVEVDVDSIIAWESSVEDHEVEVKFLNEQDLHLTYGCHYHGQAMACHEEHQDHGHEHKSLTSGFTYVQSAHQAAVEKFSKTLTRKGANFSAVDNLKVWIDGGDHDHDHKLSDDHGEGADVWSKFNYSLNGTDATIFVLCHTHGHEAEFSCHYNRAGEGEPNL
ncbi:hypothetical protein [Halobacteriovorax sp.]|uniref:hypothetical protein n=1 Tax=Halobacteriovorax sp. TaxID=2020862 RepID=UPI003569A4A8